ncbi:hypothetical protein [Tuwongella immobilis]|uniref:Uncharacterized protein n=1 Tax=Tuwongella immobilis TaxID=692036 RepID=A0A6C2YK59_9BACT|nr:hypothetical protein [Tuwongella immobilis]VIP01322.1 Uncharacterized protein OS=Rhodopirellula maiorica SM1 GN=RMSM_04800 PE=4 SV=1 [Tuwongella immobilis]VTR98070.1 Uncharacterized protein OS=Rhodopirellula maiorica SM1 GN=RMSM_04800 PE=4 SV=1 [Tuwongella immobilis]
MMPFSCDACGKALTSETRFTVQIEVYPAPDLAQLPPADPDCDHLDAMHELICEQEEADSDSDLNLLLPAYQKMQYALCPACQKRFLQDPLGLDSTTKLHFSEN